MIPIGVREDATMAMGKRQGQHQQQMWIPAADIPKIYAILRNKDVSIDKVPLADLTRNDPGHFNGSGEPFRHWDEEGQVPGTCGKCHTKEGLPEFVANGGNGAKSLVNGICDIATMSRFMKPEEIKAATPTQSRPPR